MGSPAKRAEQFRKAVQQGKPRTFGHLRDCASLKVKNRQAPACSCGKREADGGR